MSAKDKPTKMADLRPILTKAHLGRIGALAESLRMAARHVTNDMHQTPGGDAYEYRGSTNAVEELLERLNDLEHFQAGWVE